MPGGGYANLDLFERLAQAPGVTPASILGEGTFHQFHGGTTTNVADEAARRERVVSYRRHFEELRGRRARRRRPAAALRRRPGRLGRPAHPVAPLADAGLRRPARAHRRGGAARAGARRGEAGRHRVGLGPPGVAGRHAGWATRSTGTRPTSTSTRSCSPSSAPASSCWPATTAASAAGPCTPRRSATSSGHGQVVAVGGGTRPERPGHPRITYVAGAPESPDVAAEVASAGAGAARRAGDPRARRHAAGGRRVRAATRRWSRSAATWS